MALPLSAWPPCSVRHSHASQTLQRVGNTRVFVKMYILIQYGCDGPKFLFLKSDANAASPRTTSWKKH